MKRRQQRGHRWAKHEIAAHTATLNTLADARDKTPEGSVESIFLEHAFTHCLEAWLSDSFGYEVRCSDWRDGGCTVTRV
jgi:hypothetical protein